LIRLTLALWPQCAQKLLLSDWLQFLQFIAWLIII